MIDKVVVHTMDSGSIRFLQFVLNSPRKHLVRIIQKNKQIVQNICDILLNILLQNISVQKQVICKLKKHHTAINCLVYKKICDKQQTTLLLKQIPILKVIAPMLKLIDKALHNESLYQNVSHQ